MATIPPSKSPNQLAKQCLESQRRRERENERTKPCHIHCVPLVGTMYNVDSNCSIRNFNTRKMNETIKDELHSGFVILHPHNDTPRRSAFLHRPLLYSPVSRSDQNNDDITTDHRPLCQSRTPRASRSKSPAATSNTQKFTSTTHKVV